jgi:hypothetical protein
MHPISIAPNADQGNGKQGCQLRGAVGAGATELDALEALHPGVLRQILVEHIERYRDDDLDDKVEGAVEQYRDDLGRAAALVRSRHAEELAALDR